MKKHYNIDADIQVSATFSFETGVNMDGAANTYSRNGESLTHEQVLGIIRAAKGN